MSNRLAGLGPYFAADRHPAGSDPGAPWRSMAELLDTPDVSAARVAAVRGYLASAGRVPEASVPVRVAASVMHLGLAARTLSPLFALAVMGRAIGPVSLRELYWQPALGSTFALSIPEAAGSSGDGASLIPPSALELCQVASVFGLSQRVLRGNIASALTGSHTALVSAEPGLARRARGELDRWLAQPLLADAWHITGEGRFQRRSCCLIYQAAPGRKGAVCGDCILLRPILPD
ncbi:(2Fe-2S)-binding protein [Actinospica sp. MGRD01-02]|uniref:(2Fe-2S)-binding protein n=1 Tax=Actinospica acidithermotolerans TaxID=2828514 RepID=A0A941EKX9_9ACTN|nr:(2Fe-2S)-binding protein [Actinospica acidithermotolerans]MBR7829474.1 (2Fe-2S)-binding protein [Actinospica acidithermotolerans]